jgi:subtilisin family serine protease
MSRVTAAAACVLSVANGARTKRHAVAGQVSVAGVPVTNYRADAEEFMMFFKAGTGDAAIESICKGRCSLMGHPDKGGVAFAQVHSFEQMEAVAKESADLIELLETDEVDYMIPEMEAVQGQASMSAASWGLERVGVAGRAGKGKGTHIYVQDTGIRTTHNDFGGRAIPAIDLTVGALTECNGDRSCALDRQGHGSHCAGSAMGTSYGVASEALAYAVKTLSDQGSGARSWQVSALDWITTKGNRPGVISMSLGGPGQDAGYNRAIDAATAGGLTVVVAAGNSNTDACGFSPAFADKAITVGATDSNDERASYSNYGTCNDIMAPGSAITSCGVGSDSDDWTISGTSMACPHVSGGAALILEQNPGYTRDQVLASLQQSARKNFISNLMESDPTVFLWVGSASAPPSPPTRPPVPIPSCRRRAFCTGL